jgi:hypothetical protein
MTPGQDELSDYMSPGRPTRRRMIFQKQTHAKRLTGAVLVGVISCSGVAIFATSRVSHPSHDTTGAPLASKPRLPLQSSPPGPTTSTASVSQAAVSPLSGGSAEFLSADLPTRASYHPHRGARYDTGSAFGPVDATVTRTGPGNYTLNFPHLGDIRITVDVRAYDGSAICYTVEQQPVGADERIHVQCVHLVQAFPTAISPTDSRFTVALIRPPRP